MNLNKELKEIKEWYADGANNPNIKVNSFVITYGLKEEPDSNRFIRKFRNINQVLAWRVVMDKLITWYSIGTE